MKYFSIDQLASGIRERNIGAERMRLVEKWSRTGLLRNLDGFKRETMAQLLENQAAQVIKESNSLSTGHANVTSSGQIQGYSNIAFPIVRRVFGGLVANELVSIQPMSLPSGLIFYLDYTYGSNVGGDADISLNANSTFNTYTRGQSIYNNPPGRGVQSGSTGAGGMYDLMGAGYSKVHTGAFHSLVLRSNGTVFAWGGDKYSGQTNVPVGLSNVVAVAAGGLHSLAVLANITNWPVATSKAAEGITATTAVLKGVINPYGLLTSAWFEWGTNINYRATNIVQIITGSGTNEVTVTNQLTGLTSAKTYHFRLAANTIVGIVYGAD